MRISTTSSKWGNVELARPFWNHSLHRIIIDIMKKENRPMEISEITVKVLEKRRIASNTPKNTVSAILQSSTFVKRITRGVYQIVDSVDE